MRAATLTFTAVEAAIVPPVEDAATCGVAGVGVVWTVPDLTPEQARDLVDGHIVAGTGITKTVDDPGDTVTLAADLTVVAPLASPAFTGNPTAPTPTAGDNDTSVATTAFVTGAISTQHTADNDTYAQLGDGASAGAAATAALLKAWTSGESYELTSITRDSDEVPTTATVKWPDGSAGTFTRTTKNTTWLAIDAFTISHTLSGKTVTQAAVTRDSGGAVTTKPALTVA